MAAEHKIASLGAALNEDTIFTAAPVMTPAPATDPNLGLVLADQYRIEQRLGSGGMGTVYLGTQLSVDRPVAIKMLSTCIEASTEHALRFRREAEALAKLRHHNTVRLLDFGITQQSQLFIVMELLSGTTLDQLLAQRGQLGLEEALHIARQVAQSLSEAHALSIVHRDLKPGNIFICQVDGGDTFVKVMDFGVASLQFDRARSALTVRGSVLGTAAYMAPEQARGSAVDARADLYSLGVVLFEMLAGSPPFQADSAISLLLAKVTTPPPRLVDLCPKLTQFESVQLLLDKLLTIEPDERLDTANEVIALIDEILLAIGKAVSVAPPLLASTTLRRHARPWTQRSALVGAIMLGVTACLTAWSYEARARDKRDLAWLANTWDLGAAAFIDRAQRARSVVQYWSVQQPTTVTIASVPSGASVSLSGAELGKTPYQLRLTDHLEIEISMAGYAQARVPVSASGAPNVIVKLAPLASQAR